MTWQRPTSWSAETTDGAWYAEHNATGRKWKLWRNARRKYFGEFPSLKAAMEAAQ